MFITIFNLFSEKFIHNPTSTGAREREQTPLVEGRLSSVTTTQQLLQGTTPVEMVLSFTTIKAQFWWAMAKKMDG